MAYTINLTDGTLFANVADGTINTSSSMTLVGKNYAGYGAFLDENFIHLLENSADTTAPGAPLTGQLWLDKNTYVMKYYNGTLFKSLARITNSGTAPETTNAEGDIWWDTSGNQLKVYNGSGFTLVGPAAASGQGNTGAIALTVADSLATDHYVLALYSGNTIVAMVSEDTSFTPSANPGGLWGTQLIQPGITLSSNVSGVGFQGIAYDSDRLGNVVAANYLRSDTNDITTGTLTIQNDTGLSVGEDSDIRLLVSGNDALIRNQTATGNLTLQVQYSGNITTAMNVNGSTGTVSFPIGNVSLGNIFNANGNGVGNIGNSSAYFNTVFAKSTSAQYADVAERFASDTLMPPGTVVELGGAAEITQALDELSENVFGVISTNAAYLMNAGAGTDETHPPVAMTGRVPVRVIGSVRKGDRLVSAGNGLARAALPGEATPFNVIGRALTGRTESTEGLIEAIVKIN